MSLPTRDEFMALIQNARQGLPQGPSFLAVPISAKLLADQLTPVLAYRRLVAPDERTAPSFLLESVEGGERQGRYSLLGARPIFEVMARGSGTEYREEEIVDHRPSGLLNLHDLSVGEDTDESPLCIPRAIARHITLVIPPVKSRRDALPSAFLGGWVGYAAYDTVRYAEPGKLNHPPKDDRDLPDLHFAFYDGVVIFDSVDKLVHVVQIAMLEPSDEPGEAYDRAVAKLRARVEQIETHSKPLRSGRVGAEKSPAPLPSNTTRAGHAAMVEKALEYIRAGDIFQVVLGQRFERRSKADPFEVYRALRAVNPSPYMVYMQAQGCILVASSPEILCRVRKDPQGKRIVTNRPLAGTRKRGDTPEQDLALERELLADEKERAEHIMLVDLGRNDVGIVAKPGTVALPGVMEIERYSHVMHISSTVTGELREDLDCWDALRAALPVGTISGAPKIRAMQIIDELEPVRRGPYGGGMGYVGLDGQMDIALALRTIVVPTELHDEGRGVWTYHLQAAGGIVADSQIEAEYMETVNKAAGLARAIDVAEQAFS
jgi:anthranilate synthase component 1